MADVFLVLAEVLGALSGWATDVAATLNEQYGLLLPVMAGALAALAVAVVMTIRFRDAESSPVDIVRHGVAAIAVLGLLTFAVSDMRRAALAYLGITPSRPAVEFRQTKATALAAVAIRSQAERRTG